MRGPLPVRPSPRGGAGRRWAGRAGLGQSGDAARSQLQNPTLQRPPWSCAGCCYGSRGSGLRAHPVPLASGFGGLPGLGVQLSSAAGRIAVGWECATRPLRLQVPKSPNHSPLPALSGKALMGPPKFSPGISFLCHGTEIPALSPPTTPKGQGVHTLSFQLPFFPRR